MNICVHIYIRVIFDKAISKKENYMSVSSYTWMQVKRQQQRKKDPEYIKELYITIKFHIKNIRRKSTYNCQRGKRKSS